MATLEMEVPDEVYEALAERARLTGRTVVEQVLAELCGNPEEEARRRRHVVIEKLRHSPSLLSPDAPDPVDVIREIRDHDGRS